MKISHIKIYWCLIVLQHGYGQDLGKSQANSYFYMKQNGGYEYAFSTDTGLQSAQTADQSNEVTGHYMYYEKGVPFMVKYRAGVNGYQPEIIPVEKLMNGNFNDKKLQSFISTDNSLAARDSRTSAPQESHGNNYRLARTNLRSPKVSSYSIGTDSTLNFVQGALKTMQSQPMHMSFSSESGPIKHTSAHYTTSNRPVTRNEVQEINNLSLLPVATLNNYNADDSARSESSDPSGNVVRSNSYFDEARYHDINYKANDDTGFVVLSGNLPHNQLPSRSPHQTQRRQLYRNNNFNFNNYRITPDPRLTANALDERNLGKRSLRKFRRYAKW